MERGGLSLISFPALISVVLLFCFLPGVAGKANVEVIALTALKRSLHDPEDVLQNWDDSLINACTWNRITCDGNSSVTKIDLGNQGLFGQLVPQLGQLVKLQNLELYGNNISGNIPKEVGNLTHLKTLDLSSNDLSGSIPETLGNLKNLTDLRLDNNRLSGQIPGRLATIPHLAQLNLSNNQLTGDIPTSGSLSQFSYDSFANNLLNRLPPASCSVVREPTFHHITFFTSVIISSFGLGAHSANKL